MPAPDDVRVLWMKAKTLLALEVTEEDWEGLLNEQYADKPKARAPRLSRRPRAATRERTAPRSTAHEARAARGSTRCVWRRVARGSCVFSTRTTQPQPSA